MRTLYTLILALMLPLILLRLLWRGLRQSGYIENIGERFGLQTKPGRGRCIWVHAVSVGETRAAEPLIRQLLAQNEPYSILLTSMTPTGRATAVELFGDAVICTHLPYDFGSFHRRLISHFRPALLLVMETEIWPNLFHACNQKQIPSLLINARMSERSSRRYTRFAGIRLLAGRALQSLRVVAAQSEMDAARFRMLGAENIIVTGNIKFDVAPDLELLQAGWQWRSGVGSRDVLLCASTREGEEAALLDAFVRVFDRAARQKTLLVIVPRHPQRFDQVANDITNAGLRLVRRRDEMPSNENEWPDVFLGDSMGEMASYYAFCDVAVIGGSFRPLGGQNLIEACASGKPVVMGPSTFNFNDVVRLAVEGGAMLPAQDALDAMRISYHLLRDGEAKEKMSRAGLNLVAANRGASERTLTIINSALAESQVDGC